MSDNPQWQTKALRDLAKINYGKSPAGILTEEGEYPVVGTGGVERMGKVYLHDGDSIILGRKGTIDRVQFVTGKFWTIDTAYYLSHFTTSSPLWLYYFLQTIDLRQLNEATGVPSLSRELLYKINISTPPKIEQSKIADILSTVDRAIEQTETLIAKQHRIKNGLMQDLLTKGIDEDGNLRSEETHEFKDSPLGRIPVEWDCGLGSEILILKSGFPVQIINNSNHENTMYIKVDDFNSHDNINGIKKSSHSFNCSQIMGKRLLKENTIIFPKRGAAIFLNRVEILREKANIDPNIMGLITFDNIKPDFMRYVLLFRQLGNICDNSGIPQINNKHLYPLFFHIPPIREQESIIACLRKHEKQHSLNYHALNIIRALKTALMQDLLTGKVRVTPLLDGVEAGA